MITLNEYDAFQICYAFLVEQDLQNKDWEVRDLLSESDTEEWITSITGGPTADPALWYDWKICIDKFLTDKKITQQIYDYELTREQALKTMCCFLQKRYWDKKNDMLLQDAVSDLKKYITGNIPIEKTDLWKQWIECTKESLSFKEIFE